MYSLNMPVSQLRTKIRQEFERHRYVNKLPVVDMLLFQSNAEFQVGWTAANCLRGCMKALMRANNCANQYLRSYVSRQHADISPCQETLNYWKQIPHVMKYFRESENPTARLPQDFMQGFLEVNLESLSTRAS